MQYMFLIYSADDTGPQPGTPEWGALMTGYKEFNDEVSATGVLVAGQPLQGIETASTVRVRSGKTETTDGPFAETREVLGGYYLLDCKDLDEALAWAAKIPSSAFGSIEVRPILEIPA